MGSIKKKIIYFYVFNKINQNKYFFNEIFSLNYRFKKKKHFDKQNFFFFFFLFYFYGNFH